MGPCHTDAGELLEKQVGQSVPFFYLRGPGNLSVEKRQGSRTAGKLATREEFLGGGRRG